MMILLEIRKIKHIKILLKKKLWIMILSNQLKKNIKNMIKIIKIINKALIKMKIIKILQLINKIINKMIVLPYCLIKMNNMTKKLIKRIMKTSNNNMNKISKINKINKINRVIKFKS